MSTTVTVTATQDTATIQSNVTQPTFQEIMSSQVKLPPGIYTDPDALDDDMFFDSRDNWVINDNDLAHPHEDRVLSHVA